MNIENLSFGQHVWIITNWDQRIEEAVIHELYYQENDEDKKSYAQLECCTIGIIIDVATDKIYASKEKALEKFTEVHNGEVEKCINSIMKIDTPDLKDKLILFTYYSVFEGNVDLPEREAYRKLAEKCGINFNI